MRWTAAITLATLSSAACSVLPPVRVEARADRFLDDVRDAVGISALLRERSGVTLVGERTRFDATGIARATNPISLSLRPSGSFLMTVGEDGSSRSRGFDGTDAWTSDPRGIVRIHALGSRAQVLADGWLRTPLWLAAGTARFEAEELQRESTETTRVFELQRGGEALTATVRVDRATRLPYSVVLRRVGVERTLKLSDWRQERGVSFPHAIEEYSGGALLHRDVFSRRTSSTPRTFGAPRSRANDTSFEPGAGTSVPTRIDPGGRFYVQASVRTGSGSDQDVWMLLDTGFGSHAMHTPVADALGAVALGGASMRGVGGAGVSGWRSAAELGVGGFRQSSPQFVEVDTSFLTQRAGFEVGGVLGAPLFERTVVVIDDRRGQVEVYDPRDFPGRSTAWTPVVMDDSAPCIAGRIVADGRTTPTLWFRIDTGSDDTVTVARWACAAHALEGDGLDLSATQIVGVFGTVLGWRRTVDRVELGPLWLLQPPITLVRQSTDGPLSDPWIAGNIGTRTLKERRVTFDLGRNRLSVETDAAR